MIALWLYQLRPNIGGGEDLLLSILNKGTIVQVLQRPAWLKSQMRDGEATQRLAIAGSH